MILVAATAVGLVGYLEVDAEFRTWIIGVGSLLTGWAFAMIVIRLRGPRPRSRRVFRQPGMAASCVVPLAVMAAILQISIMHIAAFYKPNELTIGSGYNFFVSYNTICYCGFGVAVAWIALAMTGCRRPEPGWIDRTGRLLGVCWIVLWCCSMINPYLF
jgi:hypothetical protein